MFSGVIDAQSEHSLDEIRRGPDGRMYVATGGAANSAVVGIDNAPFVERSPDLRATVCRDIVLTGQNFKTSDFRTEDPNDTVLTGAFVPFGTETTPGQVIEATNPCGSSILVFDPESDNPEGTLEMYAWGFRHVIGFAWNQAGEMFASANSYDVRGSRPVKDEAEATYRVQEGAWYGWPDFSAALEPLTDPKFDVPNALQAPMYASDAGLPQGDLPPPGRDGPDRPQGKRARAARPVARPSLSWSSACTSWGWRATLATTGWN